MNVSRTFSIFYCFWLIAAIMSSCNNDSKLLRKALIEFNKETISIPNDMLMIWNGKYSSYRVSDELPLLITYISPDECSDCVIGHLSGNKTIFDWSDEMGSFQYMIVFSPKPEMMEYIEERLLVSDFSFPVYLDLNSGFARNNRIPEDSRLHSFLLDKTRTPVLAGNPLGSEKMKDLFFRKLSEM